MTGNAICDAAVADQTKVDSLRMKKYEVPRIANYFAASSVSNTDFSWLTLGCGAFWLLNPANPPRAVPISFVSDVFLVTYELLCPVLFRRVSVARHPSTFKSAVLSFSFVGCVLIQN